MADTNLTGGSIRISDGEKAAIEFAPARTVAVELSFTFDKDLALQEAEAAINNVTALAQRRLSAALAKDFSEPSAAVDKAIAKAVKKDKKSVVAGPEVSEATGGSGGAGEAAATDQAEGQPSELASTPEPITDQTLHHAVSLKVPKVGKDKVLELARTYKPEGASTFSIAAIPQASRAEFLEKLNALEPA